MHTEAEVVLVVAAASIGWYPEDRGAEVISGSRRWLGWSMRFEGEFIHRRLRGRRCQAQRKEAAGSEAGKSARDCSVALASMVDIAKGSKA